MATQEQDKFANAMAEGAAQFDSIREMVTPDWEAAAKAAGWTLSARKKTRGQFVDPDGNVYDGPVPDGDWKELCGEEGIEESDEAREAREQAIREDTLSVTVRSGWYSPGVREDSEPAEYEILLCTGGPACRMIGELDRGQPTSARIEVQDWFTPWTEWRGDGWNEKIALEYACAFYFGD